MADIFISYSKADRDKVVMLAAYLESEGWTVWWDTNLAVGDAYRDEIMKQLAAARAVIVLWTQTSIRSDFVRAEAGRAKADSKLIPVKEGDVGYGDIPLPFGEMHTEDLSKRELVRAAVVAQLAKPQVQPSALTLATKTLRYQALTWVGIFGGAITLYTHFRGVIELSDWAQVLITHWHDWSVAFWRFAFGWIGVQLPDAWPTLLTYLSFCIVTAIGGRTYAELGSRSDITATTAILYSVLVVGLLALLVLVPSPSDEVNYVLFVLLPAVAAAITFRRNKVAAFLFVALFVGATELMAKPLAEHGFLMSILVLLAGTSVIPLILMLICPTVAIAKRLVFLAIGVTSLYALNLFSVHLVDIKALAFPEAMNAADSDRYLVRGQARLERWKGESAVADFSKSLAINPNNAMALVQRGRAYTHHTVDKPELALKDYERAISIADPDIAHKELCLLQTWTENTENALSDCDRAIHRLPRDPTLYSVRGNVHFRRADFGGAIRDYRNSLRLDVGTGIEVRVRLIQALLSSYQAREALIEIEHALFHPDYHNYTLLLRRGEAHEMLGERNYAIEAYRKAMATHTIPLAAFEASRALERLAEPIAK